MEQRNSLSSWSEVLGLEDSRRSRCVGWPIGRRNGNVDRELGSVLSECCWRLERVLEFRAESMDVVPTNDQGADELPYRIIGVDSR